MDDVEFGNEDVFAEIESDPLAEEEGLPPGVEEGDLPGDDPLAAEPQPGEFVEEPEEPEEPEETELPGEEEALAAAAAAEPDPKAVELEAKAKADAEARAAEADPPAEEPAAGPEPDPPAEADPPSEPKAETKKTTKKAKAKAKPKAKSDGEKRATTRDYVVLYEIEGGWAVGAEVTARSPKMALEVAFGVLVEKTKQKQFSQVVAVPASNWKPIGPLTGEQEVRSRISIG